MEHHRHAQPNANTTLDFGGQDKFIYVGTGVRIFFVVSFQTIK